MEDTAPIRDFLEKIDDEPIESLSASFDESSKSRRYSEDDWNALQQARLQYLRDWEEDMRYAQELASEGM